VNLDRDAIKQNVRTKVTELAAQLGNDAGDLTDQDIIPATGLLDSAAILELVVWYEDAYQMRLSQDEVNIDNLGSLDAMADFVIARKGA
jgi:D-alanine--poly(phosphoribitol) ligase subunit 2